MFRSEKADFRSKDVAEFRSEEMADFSSEKVDFLSEGMADFRSEAVADFRSRELSGRRPSSPFRNCLRTADREKGDRLAASDADADAAE